MNDFLRTSPLYHRVGKVDREANVIFGCKLIQTGPVNDERPFIIDQGTLSQVLTFARMAKKGLKARFTHPNLCSDGLGRHLGRWKNFRQNGEAIFADLHLAQTSFSTPHGNLGGYVLDMAENDPESFGVSIAARIADQTKEALNAWDGSPEKTIPYRMSALNAADVVGDPAATRGGLFSIETVSDRRDVPHFVSQFLGTYFADADPRTVASQALRIISTHFGVPLTLTNSTTTKPATPQPSNTLASDVKPYLEAFGDQGYIYHAKGLSLSTCFKQELGSLNQQIEALKAENANLQAKLDAALEGREIESTRRTLADTPTGQLAGFFRGQRN